MKKSFQIVWAILGILLVAGVYTSCTDDNDSGEPKISYVRITAPESSDSLLVAAGQGQLIAIIGENLKDVTEIWFNDQQSVLTPTYISSTSILVRVPSEIPGTVTNKLVLVFSNGNQLVHDFTVSINEPVINSMLCEYVPDGGVAVIRGDYFYPPLTVTFAGDKVAEIDSVGDQTLKVIVPEGAQPGQITVTSNFGSTKSDFWFRDNRNIVISSDPFTGWWNASYVVSNPGPSDPQKINGNYIRVKQVINSWGWIEVAGGRADAMGEISKNIPDEAILKPHLYNCKFEINTLKPYNNNMIKLNFGLQSENNNAYLWAPPYDTKGQWQTVVIPYDEMVKEYVSTGSVMVVEPDGYWTRVLFHGNGTLDCDISFDNFRIVPKTIEEE